MLCSIFEAISSAIRNSASQPKLAAIVKAVWRLASLAPTCAALILESDAKADPEAITQSNRARRALCFLIHIFSSGDGKEPVPYAGCFEILAKKLSVMCKSDNQSQALEQILDILKWAAGNNKQAAVAMKSCSAFLEAVKRAGDEGIEPVASLARQLYALIK